MTQGKLSKLVAYTVEVWCDYDLDDDEMESLCEAAPDAWALLGSIEGLVQQMGYALEERPKLTLRVANTADVQPEVKVIE